MMRARMARTLRTTLSVFALLLAAPAAAGAAVPGLPSVSAGDVVVREVNGAAVSAGFPVSLSAPAVTPVTVDYATRNGDATAPADFAATTGTLTFAPGEMTRTVQVPLADDGRGEDTERFALVLSDPLGAALERATGAGTIIDDDAIAVRAAPRVTMTVAPTRRGSVLVRGRVLPPAGALTSGCSSSEVSVIVRRGNRTILQRVVELDDNCAYRARLRRRAGRLRIIARFEGSEALRPANSRPAALRPY